MAVKQTYLHKGGLKPGSYFLIGKDNKASNGNLMFERVIGDFLVAKGLATTEDNCRFLLDCCSDITLTYNEDSGELCLTIGDSEQCITLQGITSVNANNAITGTGTVGDPLQWGGDLIENTTVEGQSTYLLTFSNLRNFITTVDGTSANSTFQVSGFASQPSRLRHIDKSDSNIFTTIDVDKDSISGLYHQDTNGSIGFFIYVDNTDSDNNLAFRTKGIRDGTKSNGMVPVLSDATNGKWEWNNVSATITFPGPYDNDASAGLGGVLIGQAYELSTSNDYGMAEGVIKVRRS